MLRRFAYPHYDVPDQAGEGPNTPPPNDGAGTANAPSSDTAAEAIRKSVQASAAADDTKRREAEIEQRKSAAVFEPKPRICRIVEYHDVEQGHVPAIINQVTSEGGVHVCAFDPIFGPRNFATSGKGDGPGEWRWPARD